MLSRQGREHHVHLRQHAAMSAQFDVDRAIEPRRFAVQRPQSHVAQQMGQSAANVVRLRGLLNPSFQLTENGIARNETLSRPAALVNALCAPPRPYGAQPTDDCSRAGSLALIETHAPTNLLLGLTACFVQRLVQLILICRLALRAQTCQDCEITVDLVNRHITVIRLLNSQRLTFSPVSRQRLEGADLATAHDGLHHGPVLKKRTMYGAILPLNRLPAYASLGSAGRGMPRPDQGL